MACSAIALTGCFERTPKLSQDEEKLLDATTYLFTGLEDNLDETSGKGMPWQRSVKGRAIDYWRITTNGIGFSDDEMNRKTRPSRYVRYTYRVSSPEPCSFAFEDITEFSKNDSQEDFSAYSMHNQGNGITFNLGNAHTFQFEEDGWSTYLRIVGPRAVCYASGGCENAWNDTFSGLLLGRISGDAHLDRRKKALAIIRTACPGKDF
ncbi:hypothetical protein [Bradyrhizobium embrapense]